MLIFLVALYDPLCVKQTIYSGPLMHVALGHVKKYGEILAPCVLHAKDLILRIKTTKTVEINYKSKGNCKAFNFLIIKHWK